MISYLPVATNLGRHGETVKWTPFVALWLSSGQRRSKGTLANYPGKKDGRKRLAINEQLQGLQIYSEQESPERASGNILLYW